MTSDVHGSDVGVWIWFRVKLIAVSSTLRLRLWKRRGFVLPWFDLMDQGGSMRRQLEGLGTHGYGAHEGPATQRHT